MNDRYPSIIWFLKLCGATVGAIILMCCLGAWLVHVARRNEVEEEGDVDLDQSLGSYKIQQSSPTQQQQSSTWGQRQGLLEMTQTSSRRERYLRSDFILSPIALSSGHQHSRGGGNGDGDDSDSDFELVDHEEEAKVTTAMLIR